MSRTRSRLGRMLLLAMYYGALRHLPSTSMPGGRIANRLRSRVAARLFKSAAPDIVVKRGAYFGDGSRVEIGCRSQIGEGARIANDTVIGNGVMMGLDVLVLSVRHRFDDPTAPVLDQGYDEPAPVHIEDDAWIGARAILLPGSRVGARAVVGAGAVVSGAVPPGSVVGGVPAKVIKWRVPPGHPGR